MVDREKLQRAILITLGIIILGLLVLVIVDQSKNRPAQSTETKGVDGAYKVEFLFEQDSVKVYRFYDEGHFRYFTTRGETMTSQSSGKTSYQENIK